MKVSISKLVYKVAMLASFITLAGTSNSYGLISRHRTKRAIAHINFRDTVPQNARHQLVSASREPCVSSRFGDLVLCNG